MSIKPAFKSSVISRNKHVSPAFTIVELLITVVIIAILATITIVAYNGMQQRARASAASTA
jgi:prepilin-type N-terminal cleavage/methylation domain-containing protein